MAYRRSSAAHRPRTDLLAIIRIVAGIWILWHGKEVFISEWFDKQIIVWGSEGYGFSKPVLMVYGIKICEMLFGLFLILGFFTRFAALILLVTTGMLVTLEYKWHVFPYEKGELSFFYCLIWLVFIFVGGGKFSLDRKFFGW